MPGRYNLTKEDRAHLYGIADMSLRGLYHQIYKDFGIVQPKHGRNFECFNRGAHSSGTDSKPSMSISNETGQWHCFTCGIKGNLPSYWKEYVKNGPQDHNDGSFSSFLIDTLGLTSMVKIDGVNQSDKKNIQSMHDIFKRMNPMYKDRFKEDYKPDEESIRQRVAEDSALDIELNNKLVDRLLADESKKEYLLKTRKIDTAVITKYRLGLTEHGEYTFPIIDGDGTLYNIKVYNPFNSEYKWKYMFKDRPVRPTPMNNFTENKIYIFEGEPDAYCAIAFKYNGTTFGAASNTDINKLFTENIARLLFQNKEITICMDADDVGRKAAQEIAHSLYQYAKQIKIIDLDKSETNKYGLDPNKMIEVNGKMKRAEKDFTDYMKLNGFNDNAKALFDELESNTVVYTENKERKRRETYKVTLQESRSSKYYSPNGNIELEIVAAVDSIDDSSYKFPTSVMVKCQAMCNVHKQSGTCKRCCIPSMPNFGKIDTQTMIFKFVREKDRTNIADPFTFELSEHDTLGLIEVTDNQKDKNLCKFLKINEACKDVVFTNNTQQSLMHVTLAKDLSEKIGEIIDPGSADIGMDVYILESDVYMNTSYKFKGIQTTAWDGQHAVLFIYHAEPLLTNIDTFKMDDDIHNILMTLRPRTGESLDAYFNRKYTVLAGAAGVTGRHDIFFINDLVYFSAIEIKNKLLPQVPRGWIEAIIAGDPRTCKTIIATFMSRHYKMGEIIGGSNAISRTGLIGGIVYNNKQPKIIWGRFPMNDRGVVVIDELSNIDYDTLNSLTYLRSEGVAVIEKIKQSKISARVRKTFLSNSRSWHEENAKEYNYGIDLLRDLCFKDQILARFDIGMVVRAKDIKEIASEYQQISSEFTEYQCQALIKWAYSKTADDIVFEPGFEELVNEMQATLLKEYHPCTQLVNQEMRAKLIRFAVSIATMTYSTLPGDYNKIYVKKEFVEYIVKILRQMYNHPNMKMNEYSKLKWKSEELGDMRFMSNILKYVNIELLLQFEETTDRDLQYRFIDYLTKVSDRRLLIVDGGNDNIKTTGIRLNELMPKFIGLLLSRNCITRGMHGKYKKTDSFNKWLSKWREEYPNVEQSDILEPGKPELTDKSYDKIKQGWKSVQ